MQQTNESIKIQAILNLRPNEGFVLEDGLVKFQSSSVTPISTVEFQKEIDKIQALEPLRLLKMEVAARLAATDIHALADQTLSPEMKQYRADLRLCYRNAQAGIGTLPTLDAQDQLVYSGFPLLPVPPV